MQYHAVAWTGCSLTIHDAKDTRVATQIDLAKMVFAKGEEVRHDGTCAVEVYQCGCRDDVVSQVFPSTVAAGRLKLQ